MTKGVRPISTLTPEQLSELLDEIPPVYIGPTWQKNEDGSWLLPERHRTIGWEVIGWVHEYLEHQGKPFEYTAEQMRFVLWWYAFDDEGEFIYRRGVLQRLKGWG